MLDVLSAVVKRCTFQDAKNTGKDPCLLGPPSLEFAPYSRVPGSRIRKDGRQGTIDQDPEFIDFLQRLTEPVTRSNNNDEGVEGIDARPAKITTTPLVEYLKEKKANKAKEVATPKTTKAQSKPDTKDSKAEKIDPRKVSIAKKEAQRSPEKSKTEKAAQDAVKAVNKPVAALKGKSEASEPASPSSKAPIGAPVTVKRERERGSASAAARILQRDLGLGPPRGDRRTSRSANLTIKPAGGVETGQKAMPVPTSPAIQSSNKLPEVTTPTASTPVQVATPSPKVAIAPPTGPRISKPHTPTTQPVSRPVPAPSGRPSRPSPSPTAGARSAFLKHANFSQGITEESLYTAFGTFGTVSRCEIDRKKGFGYVDFEDAESLKKAITASPVKVGDKGGQVVVLENKGAKTKTRTSAQQTAQGSGKPPPQPQTPPATPTKPAEVASAPAALTVTATAAATAPRGSHAPFRGGSQQNGGRVGYVGPPRGGFNRAAGRGARANFRGRGIFDNSRGGGQANGKSTGSTVATSPAPGPASEPTSAAAEAKVGGPGE
jgi:regulator of nonsense transcripts 3